MLALMDLPRQHQAAYVDRHLVAQLRPAAAGPAADRLGQLTHRGLGSLMGLG